MKKDNHINNNEQDFLGEQLENIIERSLAENKALKKILHGLEKINKENENKFIKQKTSK